MTNVAMVKGSEKQHASRKTFFVTATILPGQGHHMASSSCFVPGNLQVLLVTLTKTIQRNIKNFEKTAAKWTTDWQQAVKCTFNAFLCRTAGSQLPCLPLVNSVGKKQMYYRNDCESASFQEPLVRQVTSLQSSSFP